MKILPLCTCYNFSNLQRPLKLCFPLSCTNLSLYMCVFLEKISLSNITFIQTCQQCLFIFVFQSVTVTCRSPHICAHALVHKTTWSWMWMLKLTIPVPWFTFGWIIYILQYPCTCVVTLITPVSSFHGFEGKLSFVLSCTKAAFSCAEPGLGFNHTPLSSLNAHIL